MISENKVDLYVHAGVFHADDVFCAAYLKKYGLDVHTHRVNEVTPDMIKSAADGCAIIADIGGEYEPESNLFDHHQPDCPVRGNGVKYAAFGMLVKNFWKEEWTWQDIFDHEFVQPLDICDNGGGFYAVSHLIKAFAPSWNDTETMDDAFDKAVDFAEGILEREFHRRASAAAAVNAVWEAAGEAVDGVVVLDRFIPFSGCLDGVSGYKAVVYPSMRGGYDCQILAKEIGRKERVGRFHHICAGVNGCTFVHQSGFMASFETAEQAVEAGKRVC